LANPRRIKLQEIPLIKERKTSCPGLMIRSGLVEDVFKQKVAFPTERPPKNTSPARK